MSFRAFSEVARVQPLHLVPMTFDQTSLRHPLKNEDEQIASYQERNVPLEEFDPIVVGLVAEEID